MCSILISRVSLIFKYSVLLIPIKTIWETIKMNKKYFKILLVEKKHMK